MGMPRTVAMIFSHRRDFDPPPTAVARSIRVPAAFESLETVAKREGHAIEHRVHEARPVALVSEPEENAARPGIVDRRALTRQVGQEQSRRGPRELAAQGSGQCRRGAAEDSGDPFEARRRRQDDSHLVPGFRESHGRTHAPRWRCSARSRRWTRTAPRKSRATRTPVPARPRRCRRPLPHCRHRLRQRRAPRAMPHFRLRSCDSVPVACVPSKRRGMWPISRWVAASRMSDHLRCGHIEPQGSRRIRHVAGMIAGEPQTDIVLGQQHFRHAREILRFMLLDPPELRRREPRHGDIAGDLAQPRFLLLELGALRRRTPVVPQNGRPDRLVRLVEQHRPVHLARQPDAGDRRQPFAGFPLQRPRRLARSPATRPRAPVPTSPGAAG